MDIQADIKWIHQEIDKVKDPTFVGKLKHLLQSVNTTTTATTASEYNNDIDNALESIKNGHYYSDEEAREISKKWGRK
jgi:L-lactate utilization protein LutC